MAGRRTTGASPGLRHRLVPATRREAPAFRASTEMDHHLQPRLCRNAAKPARQGHSVATLRQRACIGGGGALFAYRAVDGGKGDHENESRRLVDRNFLRLAARGMESRAFYGSFAA